MQEALAQPAAMVARSGSWDGNAKATIVGAVVILVIAGVGGVWTLSNRISDVRHQLTTEIGQSEGKLAGRIDGLGQRVAALEARINTIDQSLRSQSTRLSESQADLEKRVAKLPTDQRVAGIDQKVATATADIERRFALVRVAQLETRILPQLGPMTRTVTGTLLSVVPAERIIAIEDQAGRSRAFLITERTSVKAFCGAVEESIKLTDLARGTPVLIAYDSNSMGRPEVSIVAKSSCA